MAMNNILGLFAHSPLKPLQKHSNKVTECCELLVPFFEAIFREDWNAAEQFRLDISAHERQADALKREIRLKLPRGLFMPIERTDLLELVTQQDKLANYAKDIAGRMVGRQFGIPPEMHDEFMSYVRRSLDATEQAHKVIEEMDQLLEDDTDQMQIKLRKMLYEVEGRYNPIDVMFLYKIIEWVGVLADQAQRVGSRIELMLARS